VKNKETNNYLILLIEFIFRLKEDKVTATGAQLAYFLVLSIFPFTIFLLNILSFTPYLNESIVKPLIVIFPLSLQKLILDLVRETVISSSETLLSISGIIGLWAASKGTLAFINIMNKAYDVEETRSYIYTRILSIVFTIALILVLVLALLALVLGQFLASKVFLYLGFGKSFLYLWKYFRTILVLIFMVIIFALLYTLAPALESASNIKLRDSLPGAVLTSIGWIATSFAFSYYVNNFGNFAKTYGSLAAIVIMLFWLYMSSIIIIIGGELNASIKYLKDHNKFS